MNWNIWASPTAGSLDFGVHAAVFGWNDPAGVILALRGFSLNDRQTPLFGRIGTYAYGGREQRVMFSEIDDRPGYHAGVYVKHDSGLELRALHYDNRGDPTVVEGQHQRLRLADTASIHWACATTARRALALIAQWLKGTTVAGPGPSNRLGLRRPGSCWSRESSASIASRCATTISARGRMRRARHWSGRIRPRLDAGLDLETAANMSSSRPNGCRWTATYGNRAALGEAPRRARNTACSWRYACRSRLSRSVSGCPPRGVCPRRAGSAPAWPHAAMASGSSGTKNRLWLGQCCVQHPCTDQRAAQ